MKRRVVLLGAPGSGKGTLAQMVQERLGFEHISTGQWFRREIDAGSPLGRKIEEYVVRGELVPDEMVVDLVQHWLTAERIERGYMLDGFPRTRAQAEALDRFCVQVAAPLQVVLCLECPEEVLLDRLTGRRVCLSCGKVYHVRTSPSRSPRVCDACGSPLTQREDDREEVVRNRLLLYQRVTEPLVDYYRESDKLVSLNAALGSEAAYASAAQVLVS